MNLAVFGGSFDPVHRGHVGMVDYLLQRKLADEVVVVPAALSPFKAGHQAGPARRLAMLKLAFGSRPRVAIDECELNRRGPSYTSDTLEHLAATHPGDRLWLTIGQDNLTQLPRWHEVGRILEMAGLIVFPRGEQAGQRPAEPDPADLLREGGLTLAPDRVKVAADFHEPVSSRAVRARLLSGGDAAGLVPAAVAGYISRHGLYTA